MTPCAILGWALVLALGQRADARPRSVEPPYYQVEYVPSTKRGELALGVTYTIWVPPGVKTLRGVIVHQHGCGVGACKGGETAAYDLHWQALARKWDCALLGPSYHQGEKDDCKLWYDPRNGSARAFLKGLHDLGSLCGHPELEQVPWCLWGHSGGGFWSSLMQTLHPERIVAIWFRSGTAMALWEKGAIPRPDIPDAAMAIPMMCNPGVKEKDDTRFNSVWTSNVQMFKAYRARNAPIGFAPDPMTSHECGNSRYLAMPFFDACLALRLPGKAGQPLRPVDPGQAWLAPLLGTEAQPARDSKLDAKESVWLPNEAFARAWMEYVKSGMTKDATPPAVPRHVRLLGEGKLAWDADADFESGLAGFLIERDGVEIARVPEKSPLKSGRALFQGLSYHDTPTPPLAEMRFSDPTKDGKPHRYRVRAVNGAGLKSGAAEAAAK